MKERYFEQQFGEKAETIIVSPGRINIMGEHTDYNGGWVFPAAINYHVYVSLRKNNSKELRLFSKNYEEEYEVSLGNIKECKYGWANLILGVVDQFKGRIGGFDLVFSGNIPKGAGLSSSAAICCATVFGLNHLFDLELDKWQMAKIARNAEHNFAHVNCGIMDQFACLFGITNHALLLNCHSLEYKEYEFDLSGYRFILINSNVPHELHDSAYNDRRKESQRAIEFIKRTETSIFSYQDLTLDKLHAFERKLSDVEFRRARHIVTENLRVHQIANALSSRDFEEAGRLLNLSHQSEKNDYEITCIQTDFLVEELNKKATILGARQVGGGFGGCVLALARDFDLDPVLQDIGEDYKRRFGLSISHIPIRISKGCHISDTH